MIIFVASDIHGLGFIPVEAYHKLHGAYLDLPHSFVFLNGQIKNQQKIIYFFVKFNFFLCK